MPFETLPDDLVLEIVSHLDTARDVARLAASCRHLHGVLREHGWRAFVRACFPSLSVPVGATTRWDRLAEALTRQARCWDQKSFLPVGYAESGRSPAADFFNGRGGGQSRPFHPVVDARLVYDQSWELVAWGAGEDVVGRFRPLAAGDGDEAWFRMEGRPRGYQAGMGDVTAIAVAERDEKVGFVIGRANGDLHLISGAKGNAGQAVSTFKVPKPAGGLETTTWGSIGFVDVLPNQDLLAAGTRASFSLFSLDPSHAGETEPLVSHVFDREVDGQTQPSFIHSVKALDNQTIACALTGDSNPLRYLNITPTGLTAHVASKSAALLADSGLDPNGKLTVRAIQPLSPWSTPGHHGNLTLSAWDDGTCRLLDLRTPSAADAIYRDAYLPYESISSLLVYGTDRFIAGSNEYSALKVFDFRWPRPYSHTTALPCSGATPYPDPVNYSTPFVPPSVYSKCDHQRSTVCTWHSLSRLNVHRPNYRLHIHPFPTRGSRTAQPSRIYALAKASDASESFYAGVAGGIAEFVLGSRDTDPISRARGATAAGKRGWQARDISYSFAETQAHEPEDSLITIRMPHLALPCAEVWAPPESSRWHRWDERFQLPAHFGWAAVL